MRIVDSQVHIWRDRMPPPMHRQKHHFWTEALLAEMDCAGVAAAIIAPPAFYPEGNAIYPLEIERYPGRLACWGTFPVRDPASRALMPTWRNPPYMVGARFIFMTPDTQVQWTDGSMNWVYAQAEQYDVPIGVFAPGRLDAIATAVEQYPRLRLVVDHMSADLGHKGGAAFNDLPALVALARHPNVAVKLSGLPAHSAMPYPFADLHDPIHRVIDAFGPKRCFWGSDLTRLPCSYREAVALFTEELPWLYGPELSEVMGDALCRWLGWGFGSDDH